MSPYLGTTSLFVMWWAEFSPLSRFVSEQKEKVAQVMWTLNLSLLGGKLFTTATAKLTLLSPCFFGCVCVCLCVYVVLRCLWWPTVLQLYALSQMTTLPIIYIFSFCITIALLFKVLLLRYLCCALWTCFSKSIAFLCLFFFARHNCQPKCMNWNLLLFTMFALVSTADSFSCCGWF